MPFTKPREETEFDPNRLKNSLDIKSSKNPQKFGEHKIKMHPSDKKPYDYLLPTRYKQTQEEKRKKENMKPHVISLSPKEDKDIITKTIISDENISNTEINTALKNH